MHLVLRVTSSVVNRVLIDTTPLTFFRGRIASCIKSSTVHSYHEHNISKLSVETWKLCALWSGLFPCKCTSVPVCSWVSHSSVHTFNALQNSSEVEILSEQSVSFKVFGFVPLFLVELALTRDRDGREVIQLFMRWYSDVPKPAVGRASNPVRQLYQETTMCHPFLL